MKTKLFLIAVAVMAFVGTSYAQTKADKTTGKAAADTETVQTDAANRGPNYVDANNDGVCDNFENNTNRRGDGKGLRDGSGRRNGKGQGMRHGKRDGTGPHAGNGPNFVDANNNGVCDHRE